MKPEEYYAMHQKAFRAAFDFLNSHFPPGADTAWWEQTAKDAAAASAKVGGENLAVRLIAGVYQYLDDEWQRRKKDGKAEG